GGGAVLFARPSSRGRLRLAAIGDEHDAAGLVSTVVGQLPGPSTLTVPRAAVALLPPHLRPRRSDDWDWFWTAAPSPLQPGEDRVRWLEPSPEVEEELRALLTSSSPRYSAEPGAADVLRWAGIRDDAGALVACAAHLEHVPGVPHLASIASRVDARRRGLGRAVTAWITRRLVEEAGIVTLGMYADNDVARAMYGRLGYREEHRFTSGRLSEVEVSSGASGSAAARCR
ncbi:MAG: GNAT family N-acetyltransferase, partial [Actinomycetota bacterium]|nr:GNAT family N-acetyltransferase [Actinomycetota bacterium]